MIKNYILFFELRNLVGKYLKIIQDYQKISKNYTSYKKLIQSDIFN